MTLARLLAASTLPRRIVNRVMNGVCRLVLRHRVSVDWRDLKIVNSRRIEIGPNFSAGRGLWLEAVGSGTLKIGRDVNLSDWVHVAAAGRIEIGDGVLVGSNVIVTDHSHGRGYRLDPSEAAVAPNRRSIVSKGPITIGCNVWIGDGAVILTNVRVGDGCTIGANAVVTSDTPAGTTWGGIPAVQLWPPLHVSRTNMTLKDSPSTSFSTRTTTP